MTKSELTAKLAAHYPQLIAKDAEIAVNAILEAMTASIVKGPISDAERVGAGRMRRSLLMALAAVNSYGTCGLFRRCRVKRDWRFNEHSLATPALEDINPY